MYLCAISLGSLPTQYISLRHILEIKRHRFGIITPYPWDHCAISLGTLCQILKIITNNIAHCATSLGYHTPSESLPHTFGIIANTMAHCVISFGSLRHILRTIYNNIDHCTISLGSLRHRFEIITPYPWEHYAISWDHYAISLRSLCHILGIITNNIDHCATSLGYHTPLGSLQLYP